MGKNKGLSGLEMLRLYRPPRTGALLLVCGKCQQKLLERGRGRSLGNIGAALEDCAERATEQLPLRVMEVGCMKECPKDGITLCALRAGERSFPRPMVVRNAAEVEAFFAVEIVPAEVPAEPQTVVEMVSEAGLEPATVSLEG